MNWHNCEKDKPENFKDIILVCRDEKDIYWHKAYYSQKNDEWFVLCETDYWLDNNRWEVASELGENPLLWAYVELPEDLLE